MIVIVTGGRNYQERSVVYAALDRVLKKHPDMELWSGSAKGADTLALEWALSREVNYRGFPAKWSAYGHRAGPERNKAMIAEAIAVAGANADVVVVAFPGGRGTDHCVHEAQTNNIRAWKPVQEKAPHEAGPIEERT